jgi:tetratricopeptide (TPR) repeat protein
MSRTCFVVVFGFFLVLDGWAQSASVAYIEGDVSQRTRGSWAALSIGDKVAPDATLQLARGGFLELTVPGATIVLSQPGTYVLRDIFAARRAMGSGKTAAVLSRSLAALAGGPVRNQNTASGARGNDESKSDDFDYVSSSAAVFLGAAKDYIAAGNYAAAIGQLDEARDAATEAESPEVTYYLAEAYALSGKTRESFTQLSGLSPSGAETWAPDFYLLKARLLVDTFAPQAAVALLSGAGSSLAADSRRAPLYYFLLTLAYQGAGDAANARRAFERLTTIAADSDLAKTAADAMKTQ